MDGAAAPCQAVVTLSERGDARVLAAVDEAGGISLIGCASELTRAALTTVAQELLVFTGRLWRMPTDEFSAVFEKALGRGLGDYLSSKAAIGWSEKSFRAGLKQSLEHGRFPVVLLLAGTNPEVVEAFDHLESHNLSVRLLGVEVYDCDGVEVIMPKLLAATEPSPHEEEEPARLAPQPPLPQSRTQPKSPIYTARPAPPDKKMPWADLPAPDADELEAATVEQVAESDVSDFAAEPEAESQVDEPEAATVEHVAEEPESVPQPEPAPARKVPLSGQPSPRELKPVPGRPQPAPKPPAVRMAYDGTIPGVMAGKRPPPKPTGTPETSKGQEQRTQKG